MPFAIRCRLFTIAARSLFCYSSNTICHPLNATCYTLPAIHRAYPVIGFWPPFCHFAIHQTLFTTLVKCYLLSATVCSLHASCYRPFAASLLFCYFIKRYFPLIKCYLLFAAGCSPCTSCYRHFAAFLLICYLPFATCNASNYLNHVIIGPFSCPTPQPCHHPPMLHNDCLALCSPTFTHRCARCTKFATRVESPQESASARSHSAVPIAIEMGLVYPRRLQVRVTDGHGASRDPPPPRYYSISIRVATTPRLSSSIPIWCRNA